MAMHAMSVLVQKLKKVCHLKKKFKIMHLESASHVLFLLIPLRSGGPFGSKH